MILSQTGLNSGQSVTQTLPHIVVITIQRYPGNGVINCIQPAVHRGGLPIAGRRCHQRGRTPGKSIEMIDKALSGDIVLIQQWALQFRENDVS